MVRTQQPRKGGRERAAAWVATLVWLAGCLGSIELGDPGGETGGGGTGGTAAGGEAGGPCMAPPESYCDDLFDCACTACEAAAACNNGRGCLANDYCDLSFEDTCLCSDCDWNLQCVVSCNQDGTCEPVWEGCGCSDCASEPECADSALECASGEPDGICDLFLETCLCSDCMGQYECFCNDDGWCDSYEPCACADCDRYFGCTQACDDNGWCVAFEEGCACGDCHGEEVCLDNLAACLGGVVDGTCGQFESCGCPDCMVDYRCICNDDGSCDYGEPCVCADCDADIYCLGHCEDDGDCDALNEGCTCADCATEAPCLDNVAACAGGVADGICAPTEPCACADCMVGRYDCACFDDLTCEYDEPCFCGDCAPESYCSSCYADGSCDLLAESCACADCASLAICSG